MAVAVSSANSRFLWFADIWVDKVELSRDNPRNVSAKEPLG